MHNLFHYERETNPTYARAKVLVNWGMVKNDHLLNSALDEYFRGLWDEYFRRLLALRPNRKPTQTLDTKCWDGLKFKR